MILGSIPANIVIAVAQPGGVSMVSIVGKMDRVEGDGTIHLCRKDISCHAVVHVPPFRDCLVMTIPVCCIVVIARAWMPRMKKGNIPVSLKREDTASGARVLEKQSIEVRSVEFHSVVPLLGVQGINSLVFHKWKRAQRRLRGFFG